MSFSGSAAEVIKQLELKQTLYPPEEFNWMTWTSESFQDSIHVGLLFVQHLGHGDMGGHDV